MLDRLEEVEGDKKDKEVKSFIDVMSNIKKLGKKADRTLDLMIRSEENWFLSTMNRFIR